jgi:hypothetical protein
LRIETARLASARVLSTGSTWTTSLRGHIPHRFHRGLAEFLKLRDLIFIKLEFLADFLHSQ